MGTTEKHYLLITFILLVQLANKSHNLMAHRLFVPGFLSTTANAFCPDMPAVTSYHKERENIQIFINFAGALYVPKQRRQI